MLSAAREMGTASTLDTTTIGNCATFPALWQDLSEWNMPVPAMMSRPAGTSARRSTATTRTACGFRRPSKRRRRGLVGWSLLTGDRITDRSDLRLSWKGHWSSPFRQKYAGIDMEVVGQPRHVFLADLTTTRNHVGDRRTGNPRVCGTATKGHKKARKFRPRHSKQYISRSCVFSCFSWLYLAVCTVCVFTLS